MSSTENSAISECKICLIFKHNTRNSNFVSWGHLETQRSQQIPIKAVSVALVTSERIPGAALLRRFTRKRKQLFCAERASTQSTWNMIPCQLHGGSITVTSRFVCVILAVSGPPNSLHSSSKWRGISSFWHHQRIQPDFFSSCALVLVKFYITSSSFAYRWRTNEFFLLFHPVHGFDDTCIVVGKYSAPTQAPALKVPQHLGLRWPPAKLQLLVATDWTHSNALLQVHCSDPSEGYPARLWHQGIPPDHLWLLLLLHVFVRCPPLQHLLCLIGFSDSTKPDWHVPESACGNVVPYWGFGFEWNPQFPLFHIASNPWTPHCLKSSPWPVLQRLLSLLQEPHGALLHCSGVHPIQLQTRSDLPVVVLLKSGSLANLQLRFLLREFFCSNVSMQENQLWKRMWIKTPQQKSTMHCFSVPLQLHGKHLEMPLLLQACWVAQGTLQVTSCKWLLQFVSSAKHFQPFQHVLRTPPVQHLQRTGCRSNLFHAWDTEAFALSNTLYQYLQGFHSFQLVSKLLNHLAFSPAPTRSFRSNGGRPLPCLHANWRAEELSVYWMCSTSLARMNSAHAFMNMPSHLLLTIECSSLSQLDRLTTFWLRLLPYANEELRKCIPHEVDRFLLELQSASV